MPRSRLAGSRGRSGRAADLSWSGDKPWALFCGGHRITTAACATQTIASELGAALLWKDAGHSRFAELDVFRTPDEPAFGGRQGFSGSRDLLYDALRSVAGAAQGVAREYEGEGRDVGFEIPEFGVVVVPLIVVEGLLFEVRQIDSEGLALSEVSHSRVHWRGAGHKPFAHTTIDVVSSQALPEFLTERAAAVKKLLDLMSSSTDELLRCIAEGSLDNLNVPRAARGVVGYPPLIRRLRESFKQLPASSSTSASSE